ncbi:glucokinase regulatory protein [Microtus pennsylvanicus]|uniref:glucokinase regulatory protein n=1 Tax=Microtus pennsylvanicus TaxID=10058 RepID=UPI003F6B7980
MPGTKRYQHVIETPEPGEWELSGYEAAVPITEKSNPLTQNLDKADAEKIVQLLGQCDAEIFQEEGQIVHTYQRLYSESVLTTMLQVAGKVQEVLTEPDGGLVVLSGGRTSGRMAFLMSVSGDRSAVASQERTEDSALHGTDELKKVAAGKKRVTVIGISVGLSAPFVAGQMDYCMDNAAVFLPVLVGFNPSEGLSGSSWKKGRSTTKILLETLLLVAHRTVDLGVVASQSLEKKGRMYLVGWQTLGIIAIMDGLECIHTFGADFQDVRGFLMGDHNDMFNQKAELTNQAPLKRLFPSISSITWPLLFFEYEGSYVQRSRVSVFQKFQRELSTKWVLNTVSTRAHVLLGKTLQNHMLNFRIANSKLFWRALAMLQWFSGQSKARCIESLLQAIHFPQPLSDDVRAAPISHHVQVAHEKEKVTPTALLSLLQCCSITEAKARLAAAPSVCEVIRSALSGPGQKRTTRALGDPTAYSAVN